MPGDPALDALFLPFDDDLLPPPDGGVFLGARDGAALRRWARSGLACEQEFRPAAAALERAGYEVIADDTPADGHARTVLVLPPRQREQARALLARALRLEPGPIRKQQQPQGEDIGP